MSANGQTGQLRVLASAVMTALIWSIGGPLMLAFFSLMLAASGYDAASAVAGALLSAFLLSPDFFLGLSILGIGVRAVSATVGPDSVRGLVSLGIGVLTWIALCAWLSSGSKPLIHLWPWVLVFGITGAICGVSSSLAWPEPGDENAMSREDPWKKPWLYPDETARLLSRDPTPPPKQSPDRDGA